MSSKTGKQPTVVKLTCFKDKALILDAALEKLIGNQIFRVSEDYAERTRWIRSKLFPCMKKFCDDNMIAFLNYDKLCTGMRMINRMI